MKFSVKSAIGTGLAVLALTTRASAQGCVLCYTSLANSGPKALQAFEIAMFVLLIPALLLFLSVFFFILRRARVADSAGLLPSAKRVFPRWRVSSSTIKPAEGRA